MFSVVFFEIFRPSASELCFKCSSVSRKISLDLTFFLKKTTLARSRNRLPTIFSTFFDWEAYFNFQHFRKSKIDASESYFKPAFLAVQKQNLLYTCRIIKQTWAKPRLLKWELDVFWAKSALFKCENQPRFFCMYQHEVHKTKCTTAWVFAISCFNITVNSTFWPSAFGIFCEKSSY